jgi:hypothetical protein
LLVSFPPYRCIGDRLRVTVSIDTERVDVFTESPTPEYIGLFVIIGDIFFIGLFDDKISAVVVLIDVSVWDTPVDGDNDFG